MALARKAGCCVGDFQAQKFANIAWSFAMLGLLDAQQFTALAREAEHCMGDFTPQNLANIAWAVATVGQPDAQLFTALAKEAERHVGAFNPQNLANTEWAFTTLGSWVCGCSWRRQDQQRDTRVASPRRNSPTQHGHLRR